MSQRIVYRCDRCGKEYDTSREQYRYTVKKDEGSSVSRKLDLCYECYDALRAFLEVLE